MVNGWTDDSRLVGHQPFLGKLVSRLVLGEERTLVDYPSGTVVCLERASASGPGCTQLRVAVWKGCCTPCVRANEGRALPSRPGAFTSRPRSIRFRIADGGVVWWRKSGPGVAVVPCFVYEWSLKATPLAAGFFNSGIRCELLEKLWRKTSRTHPASSRPLARSLSKSSIDSSNEDPT